MSCIKFTISFLLLTVLVSPRLEAKQSSERSHFPNKFAKSFAKAAVASDTPICSKVGKDILRRNGSAVDAAIAAMLCVGTVNFHSTGIGGGGYMTVFDKKSGKVEVIDFRETVPSSISEKDFGDEIILSNVTNSSKDAKLVRGGKSVAVPGMLKGFELAHQRFGRLPWKTLFEPAASIAEKGFIVTEATRKAYESVQTNLNSTEYIALKNFLDILNSTVTTDLVFKNPSLARNLRILANAGNSDPFYHGALGQEIIRVNEQYNGTMTMEDLKNYKAIVRKPIVLKLNDQIIYTPPPPAGGFTLATILGILSGYNFSSRSLAALDDESAFTHDFVEAMKWSYAKANILCDPDYFRITSAKSFNSKDIPIRRRMATKELRRLLNEQRYFEIREKILNEKSFSSVHYYEQDGIVGQHHGTTHMSILSEDGSAVSLTTSINQYFGSYVFSDTLGFTLNNELSDFKDLGGNAFGGTETFANYIIPGKRPSSYMCPSIVRNNNGDVSMVIGASGGTKIPSILAQIFIDYFWLDMDLKTANERKRFHSQLAPNWVFVEKGFSMDIRRKLEMLGHKTTDHIEFLTSNPKSPFGVCQTIVVDDGTHPLPIKAVSDSRKLGEPDGY